MLSAEMSSAMICTSRLPSRCLDLPLEDFQQPGPAAIDILAHRLAAFGAHLLELAVLEFDARRVRAVRNESHFHFGADGRIRLPAAVDVPGHHEALGRLPNDDFPHIGARTIFRQFVPIPADTGFHDDRLPRCFADAMVERPPAPETRGEDVECMRWARADANALAHGRDSEGGCHRSWSFCSLLPSSTSAWNAASASSQN